MLAAAALLVTLGAPQTITLRRGLEITPLTGEPAYKYWTVEDTTLDVTQQNTPQGASSNLYSGDGNLILIDFRDIPRAIGPNKKIAAATLTLGLIKGDPKLTSVRIVKKPWTEGPLNTIGGILRGTTDPGIWSATFRSRRFSKPESIPWQRSGALGDEDSETYSGATLSKVDDLTYRIDGLAEAIQKRVDRPQDYFGFLLQFESKVEFLSGNATIDRPTLNLTVDEKAPEKGPDLAVTMITRSPEYPRYEPTPVPSAKRWPDDGEELTYTVQIKNIGDAPAETFDGQWLIDDSKPQIVSSPEKLNPGQTATLELKLPFKNIHDDHRTQPLAFKLFTKGADAYRANNRLEIARTGLTVEIVVPKSVYDQVAGQANPIGTKCFEDWAQYQISAINDTFFPGSRFSIAPNGILERVRLQKITVADQPTPAPHADVQLFIKDKPAQLGPDVALIKELAKQMGLVPLPSQGKPDRFPGILGYGDTRADITIPPSFFVPANAEYNPIASQEFLEGTGLFSMTDAIALMSNLGKRSSVPGDYLYDLPAAILLDLKDSGAKPLGEAEVDVVPVIAGVEGPSIFQGKSTGAPITLPSLAASGETATGHTLKTNPFGEVSRDGNNPFLRVKVTRLGITQVEEIKLWQVVNAYHRGQRGVAFFQIQMNLPQKPIAAVDLAEGKPNARDIVLPAKAGEAIEIDLGGDHTIGKVTIAGTPWRTFDISVRTEGQDPKLAMPFYRELDSEWRMAGAASVDYYGTPVKGRYVRITSKRDQAGAKLGRISVFAVQ